MLNVSETKKNVSLLPKVTAYYPLFLITVGTILNLLTLAVLCRSPFRNNKKQPAMHYMRAIAVFDILMLYGWNLDHYLSYAYGFTLLRYSVPSCKIIIFVNYLSSQSSAWLRVFVCFDRYLTLSRLTRTWFNQSKGVLTIITSTVVVIGAVNSHFILIACFVEPDGIVNPQAPHYMIFPMWDYIHLVIYLGVPFVLIVVFNSGLVYHLLRFRRQSTLRESRIRHRAISITLLVTTSLFLILSTPSSITFPFFYTKVGITLLRLVDNIHFTYHILSFPLYLITFTEFRRECLFMIFGWKKTQKVTAFNLAMMNCA